MTAATLTRARTPDGDPSAPLCPAVSPESAVPCDLPDRREAHGTGHLGTHPDLGRPHRVGWYSTAADHARWGTRTAPADEGDDET